MLDQVKTKVLSKEALESLVAYSVFADDDNDEIEIIVDLSELNGEEE